MNRTLLAALVLFTASSAAVAQQPVSYSRDVRPFLAKYCLECHNAKSAKAGLNLETVKAIHEGSDGGAVLEAGKPDASRIVLLVEGKDKPPMPPKTAKFHPAKQEIGILRAWVAAGAKDDGGAIKVVIPDIKPHKERPAPVTALCYADVTLLAAARDSRLFWLDPATGSETALRTDLANWELAQKWWKGGPPRSQAVTALARGGTHFVVAKGSPGTWGDVVLWDTQAVPPCPHDDTILDVAVSPAGVIATAGYDARIHLLDPKTVTCRTLKEHSDAVYGVAFSPDGTRLASCSADRAVKVWDVATGKLLYTLGEAADWLYSVAWSPDGKSIAAGGVDRSIRVYAPGDHGAKLVHSVFAHQEPVQKLLYSRDSKTLYSVGQGGSLKAWDAARMVERKVYDRQPESVLCMALRPDGMQIALGRYDGVVVLIDEATGKVQAQSDGKKAPPTPKKAAPQVKKITPAAIPRGKTTVVTLGGTGLDQLGAIDSTIPGTRIILRPGTSDRREAEITVPAATTPGNYVLQLRTEGGPTGAANLIVDAYDAIPEKDAGGSPTTGQKVALPATVVGGLDRAGDVDFFRFDVQSGQQLGVQIVTAAIGSKLEPVLQVTDLSGRVLAEGHGGQIGYTFAKAGTYAIGVRDRELRGGPNMPYRLHLGEIPVVTAFFPLGLRRGTETDVLLEGAFLGTAKLHVKAPADAAPGSKIPVSLTTPRGTPLGLPQLVVGEFPEVQEDLIARVDPPSMLGPIPVPGTANGVLRQPGCADVWSFHARKGQRLIVETAARRLGSDLDSFIEILDKDNQLVPRAVMRCQAKTYVTFRDHDSNGAGIRLEAWSELATDDFLYVNGELMKIQDLPPNPDADCTFFNAGGRRLGYLDTTPTHHAMNTPMYKVRIHPPGTAFPPNGFPVFTLYYRNDDGGPGYGRDSRIFFDPPADGEYRVRVRDAQGLGGPRFAYRLTIRPPQPSFAVRFSPTAPSVPRGGSASIAISADRIDGYDGPIAVRFEDLPPGLSAPPTMIEAGTFSTAVALYAEPGAKLPAKPLPIRLVAEAVTGGQKQTREARGEAPKLIDPGDIVTVTEESVVTIHPGGQAKLTVHVERRNGFNGRIPLEVRGLPHGVHALDVGLNGILVNENETRRTVTIYAEPWVQPMAHPIVVLARREGKNTEHGARSVLLKVTGK